MIKSSLPKTRSAAGKCESADKWSGECGGSVGGIVAHFGADSVKMIAESMGISNLADDAARVLADDITTRLKCVAQDARKFASHGRRGSVAVADMDHALKNKNVPPLLGYSDPELTPFRFATGGGRELYFQEEREQDLSDIVSQSALKLPLDVALKCHWLSIEGVQPAIPENPPPLSRERLRVESIDPCSVLKGTGDDYQHKFISHSKKRKVEVIQVKQYATGELSVEQQLYYKEITEACVGSDEKRRLEALQSLTYDSGLHQMLPRLCIFIAEGVKVNVVQNNLALLIYLMRMVKAMFDNHNLYLEKYLHELMPTVITCIVSKQLCLRPEHDNHWALRDFGSRLLAHICRHFNTSTNNIQVRVTQLLSQALDKDRIALSSLYGAISCFCEMGQEVHKAFLLRRLKQIGDRIRFAMEGLGVSSADKSAAEHIEALVLRVVPQTLKNSRSPPDSLDEYKAEFGYLAAPLHSAVVSLRASSGQPRPIGASQFSSASIATYRRVSVNVSTPLQSTPKQYTIIQQSTQPTTPSTSVFRIHSAKQDTRFLPIPSPSSNAQ